MKKLIALTFFFIFTFSSVLQAKSAVKNLEFGVRCTIGSMMSVKSAKVNVSEFVTFAVPEAYFELRPLSSLNWLGIEASGYIGNTNPYLLGDVKEMTLPTVTIKGHMGPAYLGLGGQLTSASGSYEYTSGSTKTKYPSSGGGFGLVVQAGLNFNVYKSLFLGADIKYTPMSSFSIDFSSTDKAVVSNMLTTALGASYRW